MKMRVLIVDDEISICRSLKLGLTDFGYEVAYVNNIDDAMSTLNTFNAQVILTDLRLKNESGIDLIDKVKDYDSDIEIIVMTAYSDISSAVESIKKGAFDYVNKPFELDEINIIIHRAFENQQLKNKLQLLETQTKGNDETMVGNCDNMLETINKVKIVADNDNVTVLIRGETGTGKELIADMIHKNSVRSEMPLIKINCSTIHQHLVESELFGHEKNAFTSAEAKKKGLFEIANGGTVFLDELGELSMDTQAKLLRFLEEKKLRRVGGIDDIHVDIRIIAATNKDLESAIKENRFREDLFYRLNVIPIEMPPLRKRGEDVILLAEFFLNKYNKRFGKEIKAIDDQAKAYLLEYHWPGNIRELKNIIERIVILSNHSTVTVDDLPKEVKTLAPADKGLAANPAGDVGVSETIPLVDTIESIEKSYIESALKKHKNNQSKAAETLEISRFTLKRKMEKYGIEI